MSIEPMEEVNEFEAQEVPVRIQSTNETSVTFSVSQTVKEEGALSWMATAYTSSEDGSQKCEIVE